MFRALTHHLPAERAQAEPDDAPPDEGEERDGPHDEAQGAEDHADPDEDQEQASARFPP